MPTNDERREVAARLRTVTREETEWLFLNEILSALIGGFTVTKENEPDKLLIIDRLADLIEPEPERTCRNIAENYGDDRFEFVCSECTYAVPLYEYGPEVGEHCKGCGAKVVE